MDVAQDLGIRRTLLLAVLNVRDLLPKSLACDSTREFGSKDKGKLLKPLFFQSF